MPLLRAFLLGFDFHTQITISAWAVRLIDSLRKMFNFVYYMTVAVNGLNTEILLINWFISGSIFPVLSAKSEGVQKSLAYAD